MDYSKVADRAADHLARVGADLCDPSLQTTGLLGGHQRDCHHDLGCVEQCPQRTIPLERGSVARPRVVTLCGSTRFYAAFMEANYRATLAGRVVLSVGFYPDARDSQGDEKPGVPIHGESVGITPEQKLVCDELHKRKIDISDEIFVLNVGGYIGDSTRGEIEHAHRIGVPVHYLEDVYGNDAGYRRSIGYDYVRTASDAPVSIDTCSR